MLEYFWKPMEKQVFRTTHPNEPQGTIRNRFKIGLRGQQVVLFLLVALMPLFAVSLAIKILGENALKGTVGEKTMCF